MRKKVVFKGSFGEYFLKSLGLLLLSVITFGLAFPYWQYWSVKYFFSELEIDGKKVHFTGNFWEFFIISFALSILSAITFGIAVPYWVYWTFKYFFTNMEVEE